MRRGRFGIVTVPTILGVGGSCYVYVNTPLKKFSFNRKLKVKNKFYNVGVNSLKLKIKMTKKKKCVLEIRVN